MNKSSKKAVSSSVTELNLKTLSSVNGGSAIGTIILVGKFAHTAWTLLNPIKAKAPGVPQWQGGRRFYA
jgi:hypothetical protein